MVRAKFRVYELRASDFGNGYIQKRIILTAQYDDSIPEDRRFQKATPTGSIEMQIENQAAIDALKVGSDFYVDFTPVE